jgi:hypothetical protein
MGKLRLAHGTLSAALDEINSTALSREQVRIARQPTVGSRLFMQIVIDCLEDCHGGN